MSNVNNVKRDTSKDTKIELGGREREVRYDMNAFAELEKRYGSIEAAMETLTSGKIGEIRVILWAGLIHSEVAEFDEITGEPIKYSITPYQVGSWVESPSEIAPIAKVVGIAMGRNMPEPENLPQEVKDKLKALELAPNEAAKNG